MPPRSRTKPKFASQDVIIPDVIVPTAPFEELFLQEDDDDLVSEDDSAKFVEEINNKINTSYQQSTPIAAPSIQTPYVRKSGRFPCVVCKKEFVDDEHLQRHAATHQSGEPIMKRRSINTNNNMAKRARLNDSSNDSAPASGTEESVEVSCGICKTKYSDAELLKSHILTGVHGTEKCELCKLVFASVDFFAKHVMTIHSGIKSAFATPIRPRQIAYRNTSKSTTPKVVDPDLSCAECNKQFLNKEFLQKHHNEVHNGVVKPFARATVTQRNIMTPPPPTTNRGISLGQTYDITDDYIDSLLEEAEDDPSEDVTAAEKDKDFVVEKEPVIEKDVGVRASRRATRFSGKYNDG